MIGCAENFTQRNNYCYRYFERHKAFYPAQQHCKSHAAYLVTIYSQYEQQFLHNLSGGVAHWIALNDAEGPGGHHVEGIFKWDNDYEPISYQNWQKGEPNNKNHLDCVASNEMGWFMVISGCAAAKLPYICKQTAGKYDNYCFMLTTSTCYSSSHRTTAVEELDWSQRNLDDDITDNYCSVNLHCTM